MSVWSRRITADAAFWGIVSGFVFNAGPKGLVTLGWLELPYWLDPVLLGALVSLGVVLVVSRRGAPSREEQRYRLRMHRTPPEEQNPEQVRRTRRLPVLLVIYSVGIAVLFAVAYLPAYRAASGESASAEAILLSVGPVLWTFTAVVAWWVIGRSYGVKPLSRTSS
jgi:sodium/pantothenate symporter